MYYKTENYNIKSKIRVLFTEVSLLIKRAYDVEQLCDYNKRLCSIENDNARVMLLNNSKEPLLYSNIKVYR